MVWCMCVYIMCGYRVRLMAGPSRPEGSYHNDNNLRSETIFKEDRRYYLDLKENHRGRFLKVKTNFGFILW